jgi:hypothetical protein
MKKLILSLVLGLFVFFAISPVTVSAQSAPTGPVITYVKVGNALSTPTHAATDTVTNTTAKYQYAVVQGANLHVTFQSLFTKVTGTPAGTVALQGSIDGLNWSTTLGTAFTLTDVSTQVASFVVAPSSYQYYRIVVTPTGTQSSRIATKVLVRRN